MVKKERKKSRRRKRILFGFLIVVVIAAVVVLLGWKVFTVERVDVEGNEIYSDSKIEQWVLNDEYSWNSLYVYFKYKLKHMDEIPFVDSMEISLKSPHVLQVEVYEKGVLGYVYVPSAGKNAYIDKDGFVVELSNEIIPGTTKISGLSVQQAVLYEKLPLDNNSILKLLLNVSQLLSKYELKPDLIYLTDRDEAVLCYGTVQVNVGSNIYLNEKIVRLQKIMPQIQGMTGTLHLEDWTESNTDIVFSKDEVIDIPDDVQTVPVKEEEESQIQGEIQLNEEPETSGTDTAEDGQAQEPAELD